MLGFRYPATRLINSLLKGCIKYNSVISTKKINLCTTMEGDKYTLKQVVQQLEKFADPKLAEPWDNVGLLVEPTLPHEVSTVLLTNDLTLPVLDEAVKLKTDLIISYHPPIFAPLKRITQSSWKEKIIATCLENRIAVYSPHTAWDAMNGALGDSLASAFEPYLMSVEPLIPNDDDNDIMFDVIIQNRHRNSLEKHAPIIYCLNENDISGNHIYRISTSKEIATKIASSVDCKVIKVEQVGKKSNSKNGMGRKVHLKCGCLLSQCVELIKSYTGLKHVRLATSINHNSETLIKTVALVPGSGASLLKGVKADLYVTGEMFHHDLLDASHRDASVILTNHSDSERPFLNKFKGYLSSKLPNLNIKISSADRDPVETV